MDKVKIGLPIEYEDKNNIVRNGLFLREPEIKELEKRLKEINKITDLKQQCKNQKGVIDKAIEYIKENMYSYYDNNGEKYIEETIFERNANPKELLDILQNKEVLE